VNKKNVPQQSGAQKEIIGSPLVVGGIHKMPLSRAVRAGDWVFVSGVTAIDQNGAIVLGGIEDQTRSVLETIRKLLADADCTMADVVKTTVWLTDTRDFWSFNRIYGEFFSEDAPARSTLQSGLMLDCKVEIEALAYKPR
jgi:reactive intermediate/imine deaminase